MEEKNMMVELEEVNDVDEANTETKSGKGNFFVGMAVGGIITLGVKYLVKRITKAVAKKIHKSDMIKVDAEVVDTDNGWDANDSDSAAYPD